MAAAVLFALAAGGGANAQMGWPASAPLRQAIDSRCNGFAGPTSAFRPVTLARYSTSTARARSPWLQSDEKRNEAIQGSPAFVAGDFVAIRAVPPKIFVAIVASTDATGDGGVGTTYCYVKGHLARVEVEVADVSDEMSWTRTAYYDGGKPIAENVMARDLARKRVRPAPPVPEAALRIVAYRTPQSLPFYGAYKAALAGTLPKAP